MVGVVHTRAMSVQYDEAADVLTVNGVRYSGCFFRGLSVIRPSERTFRIMKRGDGVVTLQDVLTGSEPEV